MKIQEKMAWVEEHCQKQRERLIIRECSICGYSLGYFFSGDSLYFDSGCYCIHQMVPPRRLQKEDLQYTFEKNPTWIPVLLDNGKRILQLNQQA